VIRTDGKGEEVIGEGVEFSDGAVAVRSFAPWATLILGSTTELLALYQDIRLSWLEAKAGLDADGLQAYLLRRRDP